MKKKILLLHGWNYRNYTNMTSEKDAWHNREELVKRLSQKYEIYKINFPGFCGEPEPNRTWDLSDFANYVREYLEKNNLKPDYILGYSFGGAVAIEYNLIFDNNQKLILISPAIIRNNDKSRKFIKTPKIIEPLRNKIRDIYLIHIIKNNYMVHGTKFLRDTYQKIVRIELLEQISQINPDKILIVYGSEDTMVNPNYVINNIPIEYKKCIKVIQGGGHDIANTNSKEIVDIIDKITNC